MTRNFSGVPPERKKAKPRKALWIALAMVLSLLLLGTMPKLFFILFAIALLVALGGLVGGKIPGLQRMKRKGFAGLAAVFAGSLVLGAAVLNVAQAGRSTGDGANQLVAEAVAEEPAATQPAEPSLADFLGEACDGDDLVMEQGDEQLFCDESGTGLLAWVSPEEHEQLALAAREKETEEQAAAEEAAKQAEAENKKAEEREIAELAAVQKAEEERLAQQKAEEMAAAEEQQRIARQQEARLAEQAEATKAPVQEAPRSVSYKNCTAVRAAGAAPIHAGDPGYSRKLDRDGDGVACE